MMIENGFDFSLLIAALIAAGGGFFYLARPAINRLTAWITKSRRRP